MRSEHVAAVILLLGCASRAAWAADLTVNVTDSAGRPLLNAVVYAEPVGKQPPPPALYRLSAWYPGPVFAPVVSEVRVGGEAITQQVRIDVSASPLRPENP